MSFGSNKVRRRQRNAGTASLELALVLIGFLMLLLGTIDIARYLFTMQTVSFLADRAARAAVVNSSFALGSVGESCPTVSGSTLPFTAPPFDPATTMCVLQNETASQSGGYVVTVTVSAPFTSVTPGLSALTGTSQITETLQITY